MEKVLSSDDLMEYISTMNKDNSVCQVFIPGKGKFTIVLQEEDQRSVAEDVEASPQLKQMIRESMEAYKEGRSLTTSELIKTLSPKDFTK
jgi:hypothetical protein